MTEVEDKFKARLNFDGYILYPVLIDMLYGESKDYYEFLNKTYGDRIYDYAKSVSQGGSEIAKSTPPVVCGPRDRLDKFLALFLAMLEDLQGKKFKVDDLKLINSNKPLFEDLGVVNEEYSFETYPHIAIVDIHKNITDYGKMKEWRVNNILECTTTRQRRRRPLILVSEIPLGAYFNDPNTFLYINLFDNNKEDNSDGDRTESVTSSAAQNDPSVRASLYGG